MADQEEKDYVVIVGLNRPRLSKIMNLVNDQREEFPSIEFVFCLAAMQSYKDAGGNSIRYMANFIHIDGSPITKYLDDEGFQASLKFVLMVGYEWTPTDGEHLEKFFSTGSISVPVKCVEPRPEFNNLHEEMEFFKHLDSEAKAKHLDAETMGPTKMAKFIIDVAKTIRIPKQKTEASIPAPTESQPKVIRINPDLSRYACRRCRTVLFGEEHLEKQHVQNLHSFKRANFDAKRPTVKCESVFCSEEVLEWLSVNGQEIEGKLACHKCKSKIGHWRWAGAQVGSVSMQRMTTTHIAISHFPFYLQCSCGTWVTPAIQIPNSKVDRILPVSERTALQGVIQHMGVIQPQL